jgi:hypothetical protein
MRAGRAAEMNTGNTERLGSTEESRAAGPAGPERSGGERSEPPRSGGAAGAARDSGGLAAVSPSAIRNPHSPLAPRLRSGRRNHRPTPARRPLGSARGDMFRRLLRRLLHMSSRPSERERARGEIPGRARAPFKRERTLRPFPFPSASPPVAPAPEAPPSDRHAPYSSGDLSTPAARAARRPLPLGVTWPYEPWRLLFFLLPSVLLSAPSASSASSAVNLLSASAARAAVNEHTNK